MFLLLFTACQKEQYILKWKVQEYAPLIYKTEIKVVDSLSSVSGIQSNVTKWMNSFSYFSILKNERNSIHIQIIGKSIINPNVRHFNQFGDLPKEMVLYKGEVLQSGKLKSTYDIPKFTVMFELPEEEVSIGDSWPLSLKLKMREENTAMKSEATINMVKFVDVLKKGDDLIAILIYEMKSSKSPEYSAFGGAVHFKGQGDFNITQGKWEKFEGYYVTASTGFNVMKQTERIKLTEASLQEFNSFLAYKAPVEIKISPEKKQISKSKTDSISSVNKKKKIEKKAKANHIAKKTDCPVLYSIQVLAAKSSVLSDSKEFKNFNYKVQEIVSDKTNELYKYKYTVGNFCSIEKARKRRDEIRKAGFPKAFIVKRTNN